MLLNQFINRNLAAINQTQKEGEGWDINIESECCCLCCYMADNKSYLTFKKVFFTLLCFILCYLVCILITTKTLHALNYDHIYFIFFRHLIPLAFSLHIFLSDCITSDIINLISNSWNIPSVWIELIISIYVWECMYICAYHFLGFTVLPNWRYC